MHLLDHLVDFLFPPRCHVCGSALAPHERFACSHCLSGLPRSGYHRTPMNPMEERFAGRFPFERATGHFIYTRDSALAILVQDMKYRAFPSIGDMLGSLVATELFSTGFFHDIDLIVPVPMHWLKQARRGYNQAERIARGISAVAGMPVEAALKAVRPHKTQTSKTLAQRLGNTAGLFAPARPDSIKGRHVLLVDDVCTTGSTLSSAAEALWTASPARLSMLTVAVTF